MVSRLLVVGLLGQVAEKDSSTGVGIRSEGNVCNVMKLLELAGGMGAGEVMGRRNEGRRWDDQNLRGDEASMKWVW